MNDDFHNFTETFDEYRNRLQGFYRYRFQFKDELVIVLLWEILEILWHIGKMLMKGNNNGK